MFKPTGEVTPEYHALPSNAGKTIAYDMQVNMVMESQLNEQQKGERLEKFFNITPNPRGAPDVESYLEQMSQEKLQTEMDAAPEGTIFQDTFGLAPEDKIRRKAFQDEATDSANTRDAMLLEVTDALGTLPSKPSAGSIFTTTRTQQDQAKTNFDRAAVVKDILKEKYNLTPGAVSGMLVSGKAKGELINLLNTDPASSTTILKLVNAYNNNEEINKEDYLDKPTEENGTEPVTLDITKPRAVGKDITFKAIDTVVGVQGVSDEYKETSKTFLQYLARAESDYGENSNTFNNPKSNATGIFQIIPSKAFFEVQRVINKTDFEPNEETGKEVREYNELLKDQLGIDLATATEADLETPLYSAAFARAYLMRYQPSIPTDPLKMAEYYADAYVKDPDTTQRDKYIRRFLLSNGFIMEGGKQTLKSLLDI